MQGSDHTVTSFGTYIIITCKSTNCVDNNKCMLFLTGLYPEVHTAVHKGKNHLSFDACLEAVVEAETALHLNMEYDKATRSLPK